jgi:hypothetical protein
MNQRRKRVSPSHGRKLSHPMSFKCHPHANYEV